MFSLPCYIKKLFLSVLFCFLVIIIFTNPANSQWSRILYEGFSDFSANGPDDMWQTYPIPDPVGPVAESDHAWGVIDSAIYNPSLGSQSFWCYGNPRDAIPGSDDYGRGMLTWAKWGPFNLSEFDEVYGGIWLWSDTELNPDGDNFYILVTNNQLENWQTHDDLTNWCKVFQYDGDTQGLWQFIDFNFTEVDTNWTFPDITGETINYMERDDCYIALVFQSDEDENTGVGVVVDDIAIDCFTYYYDFMIAYIEIYDFAEPPNRVIQPVENSSYQIILSFAFRGQENTSYEASHALYINDTVVDTMRSEWSATYEGEILSQMFDYIWTPTESGLANISIQMDIFNEVAELYEDNNDSTISVNVLEETGVPEEPVNMPEAFEIVNVYPNPFNPTVEINIYLPDRSDLQINYYSVTGQLVDTQTQSINSGGYKSLSWTPQNLSSGIYYVQVNSKFGSEFSKVIYLK